METVCGICGNSHSSYNCDVIALKRHITDNAVPSKARLTLPSAFSLKTMAGGSLEIAANETINKGTLLGPLEAPKLLTLNPAAAFPLKLFSTDIEDLQESYFDTVDENFCNWLIFISPATTSEEQNLICFQDNSSIFYAVIKDISKGDLLKVWYSPHYAKLMKASLLTEKQSSEWVQNTNSLIDVNMLLIKQQNIATRENWTCKYCSKLENDVTKFASHMLDHYTKRIRKICEICNQKFSTRLRLRKHIKIVHSDVLEKKKTVKPKQISSNVLEKKKIVKTKQISSKQCEKPAGLLGGPLLNNMLNDSLDATNLLTPALELNSLDLNSGNSNILLESDCLNVLEKKKTVKTKQISSNVLEKKKTVKTKQISSKQCEKPAGLLGGPLLNNMLNDSLDATNLLTPALELNSLDLNSGNSNILLESDCLNLGAPSLLTEDDKELNYFHFEINEMQEQYVCDICLNPFTKLKSLIQHLRKHTGQYVCSHCSKVFSRNENLLAHECSERKEMKFACNFCEKVYPLKKYLQRHLRTTHGEKITCNNCKKQFSHLSTYKTHNCAGLPSEAKKKFTCSVCDKVFFHQAYLHLHTKIHMKHLSVHKEKKNVCEICGETFTSKDCLHHHLRIHKSPLFTCNVCSKQFCRKNELNNHLLLHSDEKMFSCKICMKSFKTEKYLKKHQHIMHTQTSKSYQCPNCTTKFNSWVYLRNHLRRHLRSHRTFCQECKKEFANMAELKQHFLSHDTNFYECPFCNTFFKVKGSLVRHIKKNHAEQVDQFDFQGIKEIKTMLNSFQDEEKEVRNILKTITGEDNNFSNNISLYSNQFPSESNFIENRIETSVENNLDDIVRNLENVVNIYNANKDSYNEILKNESLNSDTSDNETDKQSFAKIDLNDLDMNII